jgi:RNA polymerase sigma-54 factor
VANYIIQQHRDYLLGLTSKIKPITEKEAAEELNLSCSTLSRIVRDRYVSTPVGIYKLRWFFRRGVGGSHTVDTDEIKEIIRELIEKENPKKPYSDRELALIIAKKYGIKISRRTVTHYRKELGIKASSKRKKR